MRDCFLVYITGGVEEWRAYQKLGTARGVVTQMRKRSWVKDVRLFRIWWVQPALGGPPKPMLEELVP